MKIIISIEVDDLTELVTVERALRDFNGVDTTVEAKPPTKKPTEKKKTTKKVTAKKETPAQKKKRIAAAKAAEEAEAAELLDTGESVTVADIETAMKKFIQANSVKAAKELFEEYGAAKLSDIDKEHYADLMEALAVE